MDICPYYSEEKNGCTLKREWGLCTEKSSDQYTYYWRECEWFKQEQKKESGK